VVSVLLSVTFACGVLIAVAHVLNKRFVAPVYDVAANLTAFACAVAASVLLGHWAPAVFSAVAIACWLVLARRTFVAVRRAAPEVREQPGDEGESNQSSIDSHGEDPHEPRPTAARAGAGS
jgi:hypothetical protein